jgi:hypothetical protein
MQRRFLRKKRTTRRSTRLRGLRTRNDNRIRGTSPSLEINRLDKVSGLRKPANSFSYCEFSIAVLARFR